MIDEGIPFNRDKASEDLDTLLNLLSILENLFFSMKIPSEIVSKYNLLKESAFSQLGLPFSSFDASKFGNSKSTASTVAPITGSRATNYSVPSSSNIDNGSTYLPIVKNLTKLSELTLEHLLTKLLNLERFLQHKESPVSDQRDCRDLEYIKQSILSELKRIDLLRLKSSRYSPKSSNDDENFSLAIAQFMYKVDNLEQKFEKAIASVEREITDFSAD